MKKGYNLEELVPIFDDSEVTKKGDIIDPQKVEIEENDNTNTKEGGDGSDGEEFPTPIVDLPDDTTPDAATEETPSSGDEGGDDTKGDPAAKAFYEGLVERGVAPQLDKEEVTWDDVAGAADYYTKELPNMIQQSIVEQTPDLGKKVIDYILTKGNDLTTEDLETFYNQHLSDVKAGNVEINSIESARGVVKNDLVSKGFGADEVELMIDVLEDKEADGKALIARAKALNELNQKSTKSDQMLVEEKARIANARQAQEELLTNSTTYIQELDWSEQRKTLAHNALVSGEAARVLSLAARAPKALAQLANLSTYFDEKTGEFKFDDFVKQVSSKEAEDLKSKLQRAASSSSAVSSKGAKEKGPRKRLLDDLRPIL